MKPEALVELRGIVKVFPGVVANAGIDLSVFPGEVVALLGENGAGKTTLMNILTGLYRPDTGEIVFRGERTVLRSPRDAIDRGIAMVHQQFRLVEPFTVAENVLLSDRGPRVRLDSDRVVGRVRELAARHGLAVDPQARISDLSVGERQRVEILKVLYRDARVLVLDEPTSVLTPQEVGHLFAAIRRIVEEGRGVVFISHKLGEVLEIADRIVVLRGGRVAGVAPRAEATPRSLAGLMLGQEMPSRPTAPATPGPVKLEVEGVSARGESGRLALDGLSLTVRGREIVGVAGVAGNGQRELAEVIAGLRPALRGRLRLDGLDITHRPPRARQDAGLAYIPEDRLREGLVATFSVVENAILRRYTRPPIAAGPLIRRRSARAYARQLVEAFHIRIPSLNAPVRHLSGGNQQRLLVAREVAEAPTALVAVHPTTGLDIAATEAVHRLLGELRARGAAMLVISESLDELLAVSDRIVVLHRGRVVGERSATDARLDEIGLLMTGVAAEAP